MKLGFEIKESHDLQTDLHRSNDFAGRRRSISVTSSGGKESAECAMIREFVNLRGGSAAVMP